MKVIKGYVSRANFDGGGIFDDHGFALIEQASKLPDDLEVLIIVPETTPQRRGAAAPLVEGGHPAPWLLMSHVDAAKLMEVPIASVQLMLDSGEIEGVETASGTMVHQHSAEKWKILRDVERKRPGRNRAGRARRGDAQSLLLDRSEREGHARSDGPLPQTPMAMSSIYTMQQLHSELRQHGWNRIHGKRCHCYECTALGIGAAAQPGPKGRNPRKARPKATPKKKKP